MPGQDVRDNALRLHDAPEVSLFIARRLRDNYIQLSSYQLLHGSLHPGSRIGIRQPWPVVSGAVLLLQSS